MTVLASRPGNNSGTVTQSVQTPRSYTTSINTALQAITSPNPTTSTSTTTSQGVGGGGGGGTMSSFQKLLEERKKLQEEKMKAQEDQLQKLRTQQNNAAVQSKFAKQASLVDLLQQLMTQSRRTASQGQRIFM